ncbi:GAF domain-containing protein [Xylophilus rhododendri]|uniref:GAF domain-containing protein n=1 Tax=Xylophilus rhododendri TaxID=2697032 RepID=A0A857J3T8_9BURK|nr:sigma-54-dependent Fis family transcriptional regulator [Xylophilus rhododendri]QHI97525.1 GAF domain-containing protein [Xylophilus rhododendri]
MPPRSPAAAPEPADERQTMEAWERLITGAPPAGIPVSRLVLASWQRSMRSAVEPRSRSAPLAALGDAMEQLRRHNQDMMGAAQGLFMASAHLLAQSGSIMLLTDPHGVVLDVAGDMRTLEAAEGIHLVAGANWHEGVVGTNGIGTALATRQPVTVHAAEHFCEGIKRWTCAAAPVFRPGSEQVLGVVDISGPPSTYQRNNLVLALSAARQIEAVLAERLVREQMQLLEAALQTPGVGDMQALLVLDGDGRLLHLRGSVAGLPLQAGERLPGLPAGLPADEWARRLPPCLRAEWLHPVRAGTRTVGAWIGVPRPSRTAAAATIATAAAAPGRAADSELDPARSSFGKLLGRSTALLGAIERASQLAPRRVGVLIQGETGVGKELFARALHGEGPRGGPFVSFNCGATTRELIAGELFGHVRGAFTGATHEGRPGRFELAHGGTLCLDEIGELPLDLQPVLLRVLEEGVVCRLGEARHRPVDVRLLAMTNRDLLQEVEAGRFRRDLYHRIAVTAIRVPPLRERAGDIELLAVHFNRLLAERHRLPMRIFSDEVMALLQAYAWPGNVRELRNVVESLLLTSGEPLVHADELPAEILAAAGRAPAAVALQMSGSLEEVERLTIERTLQAAHGNLTHAARALGVSRSTLYRKVERYQLVGRLHPAQGTPGRDRQLG